jgi:hypothetical protein
MNQYYVSKVDLKASQDDIAQVWKNGFELITLEKARARLEQVYLENPDGETLIYGLFCEGQERLVGVHCLLGKEWRCRERILSSGNMVDFVVDQQHRALGPAIKLIKCVVEAEIKRDRFLYGFPNRKAAPVFKRAGYKKLGALTRYAKVFDVRKHVEDKVPRLLLPLACAVYRAFEPAYTRLRSRQVRCHHQSAWLEGAADARFDALWKNGILNTRSSVNSSYLSNRSAAALNWRYKFFSGAEQWKLFALSDKQGVCAYAAVRFRGSVAVVGDFFSAGGAAELKCLFLSLFRALRKMKVESVTTEFLGAPGIIELLKQLGFVARESSTVYFLSDDSLCHLTANAFYMTSFDRDI